MAKQSKSSATKAATKKAATKKTATSPAAVSTAASKTPGKGKLHGKTVCFVGKFGYKDNDLREYVPLLEALGGKIVKQDAKQIDYLFVGEGRGGKMPGEVPKIQKRLPGVQVLFVPDMRLFLIPDREELMREIKKGHRGNFDRYWDGIQSVCFHSQTMIDFSDSDLQGMNLSAAYMQSINLDGSNLKRAKVDYTTFGNLQNIDFEACIGPNIYLSDVKACNFRNANLESAWMFHSIFRYNLKKAVMQVEDCDFSAAKLSKARMEHGKFSKCKFLGTALNDVEAVKTSFQACDFTKADLSRINASETKFVDAVFKDANLTRADLRKSSLAGADLRNANLSQAVLSGADLTGANIDGADFENAVLTEAKLDGVDFSKAKNYKLPVTRKAGPKLLEFSKVLAGSPNFETKAQIIYSKAEFARLEVGFLRNGKVTVESEYQREGQDVRERQQYNNLSQALLALADRWPKDKLRLDTITATGSKTLRGQKLLELTVAAWAEAFDLTTGTPEELASKLSQQQATGLKERDEIVKKLCSKGEKAWDDLGYQKREEIDLRGANFSKGKLDKIRFEKRDFKGANFSEASLKETWIIDSQCKQANFTKCNMTKGWLSGSTLAGSIFHRANLTEALLYRAKLQGVDFTDAILKKAEFDHAEYDETTIWPVGFKPTAKMVWTGDGPASNVVAKKIVVAKPGSLDFDTFLKDLGVKVETARMDKAGSMLKAERFQLFSEVKDTGLVGIVKSQSSGDLVYSCRLKSDGAFGCCTQNMRPCGGLNGALCKHLLVLIVGLAKAGQLDPATVNQWVDLSKSHKPALAEDAMSATFLRYKGAESGELDWRPTETIPEDFYAM